MYVCICIYIYIYIYIKVSRGSKAAAVEFTCDAAYVYNVCH